MSKGFDDFQYMFVATCEMTDLCSQYQLKQTSTSHRRNINPQLVSIFGPTDLLIVDKDPAITEEIIKFIQVLSIEIENK